MDGDWRSALSLLRAVTEAPAAAAARLDSGATASSSTHAGACCAPCRRCALVSLRGATAGRASFESPPPRAGAGADALRAAAAGGLAPLHAPRGCGSGGPPDAAVLRAVQLDIRSLKAHNRLLMQRTELLEGRAAAALALACGAIAAASAANAAAAAAQQSAAAEATGARLAVSALAEALMVVRAEAAAAREAAAAAQSAAERAAAATAATAAAAAASAKAAAGAAQRASDAQRVAAPAKPQAPPQPRNAPQHEPVVKAATLPPPPPPPQARAAPLAASRAPFRALTPAMLAQRGSKLGVAGSTCAAEPRTAVRGCAASTVDDAADAAEPRCSDGDAPHSPPVPSHQVAPPAASPTVYSFAAMRARVAARAGGAGAPAAERQSASSDAPPAPAEATQHAADDVPPPAAAEPAPPPAAKAPTLAAQLAAAAARKRDKEAAAQHALTAEAA
jgi:hypothetical protein